MTIRIFPRSRLLAGVLVLAVIGPRVASAAEDAWLGVPLTGSLLLSALTENYLVGEPDGAPAYLFRFGTEGDVVYMDDTGAGITGGWQIVDDRICVQWHDAPLPTCQRAWLDGNRLTFTDDAGVPVAETNLRIDLPVWAGQAE